MLSFPFSLRAEAQNGAHLPGNTPVPSLPAQGALPVLGTRAPYPPLPPAHRPRFYSLRDLQQIIYIYPGGRALTRAQMGQILLTSNKLHFVFPLKKTQKE
ncbi:hypothetical protein FKM82_017363 [Ascaphus truei]